MIAGDSLGPYAPIADDDFIAPAPRRRTGSRPCLHGAGDSTFGRARSAKRLSIAFGLAPIWRICRFGFRELGVTLEMCCIISPPKNRCSKVKAQPLRPSSTQLLSEN